MKADNYLLRTNKHNNNTTTNESYPAKVRN